MSLKAMKCPSCGADITCDDGREFGFCSYCGAKIHLHEIIEIRHSGSVAIDYSAEIKQLADNCEAQISFGDYRKAMVYANELMDKFSNEPRGYMLAIRILTRDFNENLLYKARQEDWEKVHSYLAKLNKLDSSYSSFCQNGYLWVNIAKEIEYIRRNKKAEAEVDKVLSDYEHASSSLFVTLLWVSLLIGALAFLGFISGAFGGGVLAIAVICFSATIFSIVKIIPKKEKQIDTSNVVSWEDKSNEKIRMWKAQLYNRH